MHRFPFLSRITFVFTMSLALAAPSRAQLESLPNSHLDLAYAPTRLENLLPLIAKRLGIAIDAEKSLADDVLVIQTTSVPARDVLAQIAKVEHAAWRRDFKGLHLVRTPELVAADAKADNEQIRKWVTAALAEARAKVPAPFTKEVSDAWMRKFVKIATQIANLPASNDQENRDLFQKLIQDLAAHVEATPTQGLLPRLAALMTPDQLMQVPVGQTFAFSSRPNRMQKELSRSQLDAFEKYKGDVNNLSTAILADHSFERSAVKEVLTEIVDPLTRPVSSRASAVLLVSNFGNGNFGVRLSIADGPAREVEWTEMTLLRSLSAPDRSWMPASARAAQLEIEPDLQKVLGYRREFTKQLDPEVETIIRPFENDPANHELLELTPAALLPQIARKSKLNLVASVPDSLIGNQDWDPATVATTDKVCDLLYRQGVQVHGEGGWLVVEPILSAVSRGARADRALLQTILSARASDRTLTWIETVSLAKMTGAVVAESVASNFLARYSAFTVVRKWDSMMTLQSLAKCTPSQLAAASSSEGCPLSAMSAEQRRALETEVFFDNRTRQGLATSLLDDSPQRVLAFGEPTLLYPNGLPADCRIFIRERMNGTAQTAVKPMPSQLFPAMVAEQIVRAEKASEVYDPLLVFGEQRTGTCFLSAGGAVRGLEDYSVSIFDLRKTVPLSRAPESFASLVRDVLAKIKK